jgi:hypothetical protein
MKLILHKQDKVITSNKVITSIVTHEAVEEDAMHEVQDYSNSLPVLQL